MNFSSRISLFLLIFAMGFSLLTSCVSNPQRVDGGTLTETTNCSLDGTLYGPDGLPINSGTTVRIHPRQTPDDSTSPIYSAFDTATVYTDSFGRFSIDSLDSGIYVIEADNGVYYAIMDSIIYSDPDSNIHVTDTLRAPGVIKGTIRLSAGGDPRAMLIVLWGLERLFQVQSDGSFSLNTLAAGTYTLRFIPIGAGYRVVDVSGVTVAPGQTTTVDTIEIPYTGIPIPTALSLSYDTLKQKVSLKWGSLDSVRIRGFNVYRTLSNTTHETVVVNGSKPVMGTFFIDSTAIPGNSYQYRISAIDTTGSEGERSAAVQVTLFSPFIITDSLVMSNGAGPGQFGNYARLAVGPGGSLYISDTKNNRLQKISPKGESIFSIALQAPEDITLSDDGMLYATDKGPRKVIKLDTTGAILKSWSTQSQPFFIAVDSTVVYVATLNGLDLFDTSGIFLRTIPYPAFQGVSLDVTINDSNEIFLDLDHTIYKLDKASDTLQRFFKHATTQQDSRLEFISDSKLCILTDNKDSISSTIDVFTKSGDLYTSWDTKGILHDIQFVSPKSIVCTTENGTCIYLNIENR